MTTVITNDKEVLPTYASFYFTHMFWDGFNIEPPSQMFAPLLNLMNCHALMRIKANCYPSTPEKIVHDNHVDYPFPHKGAIFYLNTNNGGTKFKGGPFVRSRANRIVFFNSDHPHAGVHCSNSRKRLVLNINYK